MGKLQPNFSWQKYQGKPEDREEQFQYRLQQQHIVTANSVNTTIDDISYFSMPRMTSETWIDGNAIWRVTVTMPTLPSSAGTVQAAHGINFANVGTFVNLEGILYAPGSPLVYSLPYVDPATLANGIGVYLDGTYVYIKVGANRSAFTNNYVTIWFTQPGVRNA